MGATILSVNMFVTHLNNFCVIFGLPILAKKGAGAKSPIARGESRNDRRKMGPSRCEIRGEANVRRSDKLITRGGNSPDFWSKRGAVYWILVTTT
jgi:hypothetical protein